MKTLYAHHFVSILAPTPRDPYGLLSGNVFTFYATKVLSEVMLKEQIVHRSDRPTQ
jgi:hypothetical protein